MVSILLYGADTWTLKAPDVRRLNSFHNLCVRTILGITRFQQWQSRITSGQLFGQFGLYWSIADFVLKQRLRGGLVIWGGWIVCGYPSNLGTYEEKTIPWHQEAMER